MRLSASRRLDAAATVATSPAPLTAQRALAALWQQRWAIGLAAAILLGSLFRLLWLRDVEYKSDEAWTFTQVQAFWQTHSLPAVGMPSSSGLPNAGMSLWIFIAISAFLPTVDPLTLSRAVQIINVIAIALLALFAQRGVPREEREAWLWSVALVAVNPLAVLFSRKLWPPEILPLVTLGLLLGWRYRSRSGGAFLAGFIGALLGQIQLTSFFLAGSFVACLLLFDRRSVHWRGWLMGSVLGFLPMVPWLLALSHGAQTADSAAIQNPGAPFAAWTNYALGFDLHYALGNDFAAFLAYPRLAGHSTYLAAALSGLVFVIFLALLTRLFLRLRATPRQTFGALFAPHRLTGLALSAAFLGFSLLLLAMLRPVYLHYFIPAFSLPGLSLAAMAQAGSSEADASYRHARRLLAATVLVQAALTIIFLAYIHQAQIIVGDYGATYGAQIHAP